MSEKVIIASDSTSDLGPELLSCHGIRTVPLGVTLSGKSYRDGIDIDPDSIYSHYEKTCELPKTAAVNIGDAKDFLRDLTADGSAAVVFTIISDMSSTYQNLRLAAANASRLAGKWAFRSAKFRSHRPNCLRMDSGMSSGQLPSQNSSAASMVARMALGGIPAMDL